MAIAIPSLILKRLHTYGSLRNSSEGVKCSVKNRLSDAELTGLYRISIDGQEVLVIGAAELLDYLP